MQGRTVGLIVFFAGLILAVAGVLALIAMSVLANLTVPGAVVGLFLLLVIALPVMGVGLYLTLAARREAAEDKAASEQRKLLDMVQTQGSLRITDAAVEMQVPSETVREWVYTLVGLGVFSGYVNWDDGVLYSSEASKLRDLSECLKCGGQVKLAGKGVTQCPYCGTEYYL